MIVKFLSIFRDVLNKYSPKKFEEKQLKAIKNLRNSLCHHFGLVCINKHEKKDVNKYKFILSSTENQEVVRCPEIEWNGFYDDMSTPVAQNKLDVQTSYQISVPSLIKIFEKTIENIKNAYLGNQLNFVNSENQTLEQRLKEIEYKYFVYYQNN